MEKCVNCGKENLEAVKGGYNIEVGFFLCMDCHAKYKNGEEEVNKKFDEFLKSRPDLRAKIDKEKKEKKSREEEQRRKEEEKVKSQIDCFYCGKKKLGFFDRPEIGGGFFLCIDCYIKYKNGDEEIKKKFDEFLESKPDLKVKINKEREEKKRREEEKKCIKEEKERIKEERKKIAQIKEAKEKEQKKLEGKRREEEQCKDEKERVKSQIDCFYCGKKSLGYFNRLEMGEGYFLCLCRDCYAKYKNGDEEVNRKFDEFIESKPDLKAKINKEREEKKRREEEKKCIKKEKERIKEEKKGIKEEKRMERERERERMYRKKEIERIKENERFANKTEEEKKQEEEIFKRFPQIISFHDICVGYYPVQPIPDEYIYHPKYCMKHPVENGVRTCCWCRKNFCGKCITEEFDGYYCEVCLVAKKSIQKQAKILACDYAALIKKESWVTDQGLTGDIGTRSQGVGLGIGGIGIGVGDSKGKINLHKNYGVTSKLEKRSICFLVLTDKGIFELPLSMIMEKYEITYGFGKDSENYPRFFEDDVWSNGYSLYISDSKKEKEKDILYSKSYFLEHESVHEWSKIMKEYEKKAKEEQKEDAFLKAKNRLEEGGKKVEKEEKLRDKEDTQNKEEDIPGKIKKLAELRDKGIITDNEFEKKKKELLERM